MKNIESIGGYILDDSEGYISPFIEGIFRGRNLPLRNI